MVFPRPPCLRGKNGFSLLPDKVNNLKQTDKLPVLKPKVLPATAKPTKPERKQTTTFAPTTAGTKDPAKKKSCISWSVKRRHRVFLVFFFCSAGQQESWEESELFKPQPSSDVDALGRKRYVGE